MMSVVASGTGLKPFDLHTVTILSSPAHVNIFVCRRPSTVSIGALVKKYTQPPCPHDNRMKPLASRRCFSNGSSLSSVANSSGYDVKNMGTLNTLNEGSIDARPAVVIAA